MVSAGVATDLTNQVLFTLIANRVVLGLTRKLGVNNLMELDGTILEDACGESKVKVEHAKKLSIHLALVFFLKVLPILVEVQLPAL